MVLLTVFSNNAQAHSTPRFQGHQRLADPKGPGYRTEPGTGDCFSFRVVNEHSTPIHLAIFLFSANGQRDILFPRAGNGNTEEVAPNQVVEWSGAPLRIYIPRGAVNCWKPQFGDNYADMLVVYATNRRVNYAPLLESGLDAEPNLRQVVRGAEELLPFLHATVPHFRNIDDERDLRTEGLKWAVIQMPFIVLPAA